MKQLSLLTAFSLILTLASCGGGGGSGGGPIIQPPIIPPIGGISRTGFAVGPISTFGSVVVNGIRYETNNATFSINGLPGTQADLKVGQFILVKAEFDANLSNAVASEVIFNDNVKGPVELIDAAQQRLVVLGQTVFITSTTSFDDNIPGGAFNGLMVGDVVEVSGLIDANGAISATRIELKPAGTVFEVLGAVTSLNATNQTFQITGLTVDYSSAQLDDFPGGIIENGQEVEAKGAAIGSNGELVASRVEYKGNGITGTDGDHIEIEGFITRYVSATDFDVANVPVTSNGSTVFEGGVATDLGLNIKVEIEGDFNASGVVVATKIDIRRAKAVRVTALVDSVNSTANSLVVLGITVNIDALTRLEDKSNADLDPLTLGNLNSGDYLEIRGTENPAGSGMILAAILERDDVDTETELQGFVTAVTDPAITILGVTIETGSAVFRDENDNAISRTEFFNRVGVNSLIKARGTETSSNVITANEVEIEIEN